MHVQYIIGIRRVGVLEFGKFDIRQVGDNIRALIVNDGGNQKTAVTGRTGYLQKIKVLMISQDFNITHLIILAAASAFD